MRQPSKAPNAIGGPTPLQSAIGMTDTVTLDFNPGYRKNGIIAEVKYPALDTDDPKALLNTKR
ncbi:MAG: hypothetical protein KKF98_14540 [Bacteroidetes bacterium]|nr:hypothetical protein [Bacteroidota bacterium]